LGFFYHSSEHEVEEDLHMSKSKESKTIKEINERIKAGKAAVVTADEMTDIVRRRGAKKAAREIDVVTTGSFRSHVLFRRPHQFRSYISSDQIL
jgi:hypothetical protein